MIFLHDPVPPDNQPQPRLAREDLSDFVEAFPALLWRIEIARSRIEFLNRRRLPCLGDKSELFMKNAEFRAAVVVEEDAPLVEEFMRTMQRGEGASALFRVRDAGGRAALVKIAAWMHPRDLRYHMGYLTELDTPVEAPDDMADTVAGLVFLLDRLPGPALLADLDAGKVLAGNARASRLFLCSRKEFEALALKDLAHRSMARIFPRLVEQIRAKGEWEGKVLLTRKKEGLFSARVSARLLPVQGRRLLLMVLDQVDAPEPANEPESKEAPRVRPGAASDHARFREDLAAKLAGRTTIGDILGVFLSAQLPERSFDAIMFSDIYARKNKVVVYGAGEQFAGGLQGERFSFQGTIAQEIERLKLDHLIVEDTLVSIKAIDWALFIPKGVRSYFAKAFYQRGVMRAVLVLCSRAPGAFPESGLTEYALLFEPFRHAIQAWRTAARALAAHSS